MDPRFRSLLAASGAAACQMKFGKEFRLAGIDRAGTETPNTPSWRRATKHDFSADPDHATFVVSFSPRAFTTLSTVARLGLPSGERALYNPSREIPVSLASWAIPRARAISPSA